MQQLYLNIKNRRIELGMSQEELAQLMGYTSRSSIAKIESGVNDIPQSKIVAFAKALRTTPGALMGWESSLNAPEIADDIVTFPVIGEIAAGYDEIGLEDWSGETVDIPKSYLCGRKKEDFFVLTVHGNSMYPLYLNGDKVLVLKQSTLNRSGDVGAIIYDGEFATLKKIEFVPGEDWLEMIPINPEYQPKRIEGVDLELCKVIGVPKLLIREIK